jgi:proteic killer suppression protein
MIKNFACKETQRLFETGKSRRFGNIARVALRKLDMIQYAADLHDLAVPPANKLEALKRDRQGQHSIRINDQWRICFIWSEGGVTAVEIVDYH